MRIDLPTVVASPVPFVQSWGGFPNPWHVKRNLRHAIHQAESQIKTEKCFLMRPEFKVYEGANEILPVSNGKVCQLTISLSGKLREHLEPLAPFSSLRGMAIAPECAQNRTLTNPSIYPVYRLIPYIKG